MQHNTTDPGGQPWPAWATEPVTLVDPDPDWRRRGERECAVLDDVLHSWSTAPTEHVGSTSIPGLPAKPIIDLQAAVYSLDQSDQVADALASLQWHFVDPAVDRREWRRFFVKVSAGRRTAHLHVMTLDSPRWRQQITFRDALRADPELTADYAALKARLAVAHVDDVRRTAQPKARSSTRCSPTASSGQAPVELAVCPR